TWQGGERDPGIKGGIDARTPPGCLVRHRGRRCAKRARRPSAPGRASPTTSTVRRRLLARRQVALSLAWRSVSVRQFPTCFSGELADLLDHDLLRLLLGAAGLVPYQAKTTIDGRVSAWGLCCRRKCAGPCALRWGTQQPDRRQSRQRRRLGRL